MKNKKLIFVKTKEKWKDIEKPDGVNAEILGNQVCSYERVNKIPKDFKDINCMDDQCPMFFDSQGHYDLYETGFNIKHMTTAETTYIKPGEKSEFYYAFTLDNYSKFCSLFKKENRLFQYHY